MEREIKEFVDSIGAIDLELFRLVFKKHNYFMINDIFLMIHISRSKKPFWGAKREYIDWFRKENDNFFLVLLTSNKTGYVYSKKEIFLKIKHHEWNLRVHDDNYKINKNTLNFRNSFSNTDVFLRKIGIIKS